MVTSASALALFQNSTSSTHNPLLFAINIIRATPPCHPSTVKDIMAEADNLQLGVVAVADDLANGKIFEFFGLPRELRNEIYAMLTEDVEI